MSDIVERLRGPIDPDDPNLWKVDKERREAAVEIERLQGEIKRLTADVDRMRAEIERLRAENKWLYDQIAAQKRTARLDSADLVDLMGRKP